MNFSKKIIFVLFAILIQTAAFAQDCVDKNLQSGQKVIVCKIENNPSVTINTWVKTGSINEDDTNTGVAHFLEHLFFKGSENVPTGEFDRILESKGAITNAATSKDYTQFYITLPAYEFDLALKLHSDMLLHPLIPPEELEKERQVVIEEINRGNDNPSNVLYNNLFALIYSSNNNHPYKRPVIGTKEVISTISRDKIMEFYNRWYTPDNMITVVSGGIEPEYVFKEVEKAFKTDKKRVQKPSYPKITPIKGLITIDETKEINEGYMAMAFSAPKFADIKDAYALDVLSVILGGANSCILNKELKEKKELVTSISTSYSQYYDDGLFIISARFEPKKTEQVINGIKDEIQNVKNNVITENDVEKAKSILKIQTLYSRESASSVAEEAGFFALYFKDKKMYNDYLKRIDAVTLEDVNRVLCKYLNTENMAQAIVLPVHTGYKEVSNIQKSNRSDLKIIEKTNDAVKYKLDNGATLIIKENKSNPIVTININSPAGGFIQSKPAIGLLASQGARRGTKSFSFEQLNTYLDENGINLSVGSSSDVFSISVKTTKDNLDKTFNIIDEIVNYPQFSQDELNKVIKNYKDYVKSLPDNSLSYGLDEYTGLAYQGFPYANNNQFMSTKTDEVTRDDIVDFYNKIFDPKNLIITIAGDISPEYAAKKTEDIFKDKSQSAISVKDYSKEIFVPKEPIKARLSNKGKETSWIITGYKTCPIYNTKDIAILKVINSIMGSGMSSRLFKSLREEKGLAYQVGTSINQYALDGSFLAYIGTNTTKEDVALKGIYEEFRKIKEEFVSDNELKEAKEKILGNMVLSLETNGDWSGMLSRYAVLGFSMDYLDELKDEIKKVSKEDIKNFANKYFNNPSFEVIVGK